MIPGFATGLPTAPRCIEVDGDATIPNPNYRKDGNCPTAQELHLTGSDSGCSQALPEPFRVAQP
jgi:hypothetical protein